MARKGIKIGMKLSYSGSVFQNISAMPGQFIQFIVSPLRYSASYANLFYDMTKTELNIQYYFQSSQFLTLFIPFTLDAEPGFTGRALKPIMNEQIAAILQ